MHTKERSARSALPWLVPLAGLATAVALAAGAAQPAGAVESTALNGAVTQSEFYPCPGSGQPPQLSECTDTTPKVDLAATSCDPNGTSAIRIVRSGPFGKPELGSGTFTETLTATIGKQNGPVVPEFQPIASSGYRASSRGFHSGALLTFTSEFEIKLTDPDGNVFRTITGTKTLSPGNTANTGVCRTYDGSTPIAAGENTLYPEGTLLTGHFYLVNAQVLTYSGTVSDFSGTSPIDGVAHEYLADSFATDGLGVNAADGTLISEFGATNPTVREFKQDTPTGTDVPVSPAPGVTLTFPSVATAGETTVTSILDIDTLAAPPPANVSVGDPPMLYDIHTTAEFGGEVRVCVPYGPVPPGETPTLWHLDSATGEWEDITDPPVDTVNRIVCGLTSSFSAFGVFTVPAGPSYTLTGPFQPVDPQPTENIAQAGQTVPVKFSLGGDYGLDVFTAGSPSSAGGPCSSAPTDGIETTSNGAGLTYDPVAQVYTYHWKTLKSWKGQCRTLTLSFLDGSSLIASFRFK